MRGLPSISSLFLSSLKTIQKNMSNHIYYFLIIRKVIGSPHESDIVNYLIKCIKFCITFLLTCWKRLNCHTNDPTSTSLHGAILELHDPIIAEVWKFIIKY